MPTHKSDTFLQLCDTLTAIRHAQSASQKIERFATYLRLLKSDADIERAVRFTGEGAFSAVSGRRVAAGPRTITLAAVSFCRIDYEKVFRPCREAAGNTPETIAKLMANLPAAIQRRKPDGLTLERIDRGFQAIASAPNGREKQHELTSLWEQMTPSEIRFMIEIIDRNPLRIGFPLPDLEQAIALANDADPERVRRLHMLTGSIGETAVIIRKKDPGNVTFRMFHPVPLMLAVSAEDAEWMSGGSIHHYVAEEHLTGIRAQTHITPEKIVLYARDGTDITPRFPDITNSLQKYSNLMWDEQSDPADRTETPHNLVLDGMICLTDGRPDPPHRRHEGRIGKNHPQQRLMERMNAKNPENGLIADNPVQFIAHDLLIWDGVPVLEEPLERRRHRLEKLGRKPGLPISRQTPLTSHEQIPILLDRARKNGNEGLIVKKRQCNYDYGRRSDAWMKIRESGGTLIAIVMYAHRQSGMGGGTFSEFTLGIRVDGDDRFEEMFVPIGRSAADIAEHEQAYVAGQIKELTVERFGSTLSLKPGIVVEVSFDTVKVNRRTKAGCVLHQPVMVAIRGDLSPSDTHTLEDVESRL